MKDLFRLAGLYHHSLVHEHDVVGNVSGIAHFVGDHDHRHAAGGKVGHQRQHALDQFGVQCRGGLIEEHHLRLHRECPRDGHPLLLSARQVGPPGVGLVRKADEFELPQRRRPPSSLFRPLVCGGRVRCCRRRSCAGTG